MGFESEEDSLASMTLKICMTSSPSREGVAALRHWTYNNKIYSAEVHSCQMDRESLPTSDNVTFQSISAELFRSFIIEQDWSQSIKRSGTFILDDSEMSTSLTIPSTIRSS